MSQDQALNHEATLSGSRPARLYTPLQVFVATVIGSPAAAAYTLAVNFSRMKQPRAARIMAIAGGLFAVAFVLAVPFMKGAQAEEGPNLAVAVVALVFAQRRQFSREAISADPAYARKSWWKVLAVGLVALAVSFVLFFAWINFLPQIGVAIDP